MYLTLIENKYLISVASAVGGVILTLLTELILSKRGRFTYFVQHFRVGVSADDAVFGSIRVTWNENPVANLYSSTVELVNESMKDFENVVISAFSSDTILLTEKTELVGTASIVNWTDEFRQNLQVNPGQTPTAEQFDLHSRRRDYLVPVINRGQVIRFHFLNAARTENQPSIWLDIVHKGLKLKFRVPQNHILGVAQPRAALVGVLLGVTLVGFVVVFVQSVWVAAVLSLAYGFVAQLPGALIVKGWRWLRESIGG